MSLPFRPYIVDAMPFYDTNFFQTSRSQNFVTNTVIPDLHDRPRQLPDDLPFLLFTNNTSYSSSVVNTASYVMYFNPQNDETSVESHFYDDTKMFDNMKFKFSRDTLIRMCSPCVRKSVVVTRAFAESIQLYGLAFKQTHLVVIDKLTSADIDSKRSQFRSSGVGSSSLTQFSATVYSTLLANVGQFTYIAYENTFDDTSLNSTALGHFVLIFHDNGRSAGICSQTRTMLQHFHGINVPLSNNYPQPCLSGSPHSGVSFQLRELLAGFDGDKTLKQYIDSRSPGVVYTPSVHQGKTLDDLLIEYRNTLTANNADHTVLNSRINSLEQLAVELQHTDTNLSASISTFSSNTQQIETRLDSLQQSADHNSTLIHSITSNAIPQIAHLYSKFDAFPEDTTIIQYIEQVVSSIYNKSLHDDKSLNDLLTLLKSSISKLHDDVAIISMQISTVSGQITIINEAIPSNLLQGRTILDIIADGDDSVRHEVVEYVHSHVGNYKVDVDAHIDGLHEKIGLNIADIMSLKQQDINIQNMVLSSSDNTLNALDVLDDKYRTITNEIIAQLPPNMQADVLQIREDIIKLHDKIHSITTSMPNLSAIRNDFSIVLEKMMSSERYQRRHGYYNIPSLGLFGNAPTVLITNEENILSQGLSKDIISEIQRPTLLTDNPTMTISFTTNDNYWLAIVSDSATPPSYSYLKWEPFHNVIGYIIYCYVGPNVRIQQRNVLYLTSGSRVYV